MLSPEGLRLKRRKVRKGTFSCWECKHRKTRCEFKPVSSSTCVSCQSRGLSCISQELADPAENSHGEVEERVVQVEALVSQLVRQRSIRQSQLSQGPSTSPDHDNNDILEGAAVGTADSTGTDDNIKLPLSSFPATAQELHSILPHPTLAALILSRGKFFSLPFHVRQQPLRKATSSITEAEQLAQISKLPSSTAHPIHFARKLIQLALCLQQLDATTSERPELQLNGPVHDAARRYLDIASRYVTSQDLLVDSLDGLETLMLEACYHINAGNLRVAWLIFRRGLAVAQLIGFPRPAEKAGCREEIMWFRLVYGDRFLSLMLGLPFAVADNSFAKKHLLAVGAPSEKLERIHVVALGRIITRNIRMQRHRCREHYEESEDNAYDDYKEIQDIDYELKQATRSLPASWWVFSTLNHVATGEEATEKTARLIVQMHHHFLLVFLHQPYLIHKPHPQPTTTSAISTRYSFDYTYSEIAVLSASREVLSRFVVLRNFHRALSYRALDDKAFTASMILLLAHLNGHRLGRANVLEHQRPHDLGIINDVLNSIEEVSHFNNDVLGSSSAQELKMLVEVEADAAAGANYSTWMEEGPVGKEGSKIRQDEDGLRLLIPYFGTLRIAKRPRPTIPGSDPVQMVELTPGVSTAAEYNQLRNMNEDGSLTITPLPLGSQLRPPVPAYVALNFDNNLMLDSSMHPSIQDVLQHPTYTLQEMSQQNQTNDVQDYTYQEVDTALFSTWMRGEAQTDESLVGTEI